MNKKANIKSNFELDARTSVIIAGADHHNTLAVMRALGINGIGFITIIHSSKFDFDCNISHSKYAEKIIIIKEDEGQFLDTLKRLRKVHKQIIFPTSDIAAYYLDKNYEILAQDYLLTGFINSPGKVVLLMDKYEQKKWADKNGFLMANSWAVDRQHDFLFDENIKFPCIVKPCISAQGNKSDIHISKSKRDLENALHKLSKFSTNNKLIIQEFIKKDYEICAAGFITPSVKSGKIIKKLRENPPNGGGSLTYAVLIDDKWINTSVNRVLDALQKEHYLGFYDIEFFVCGEEIYLNEINFRHSGNGFAINNAGNLNPYQLYMHMCGKQIHLNDYTNIYLIDDFNELSLVRLGYIGFTTFLKEFMHADAHSCFDASDNGVFIYRLRKMIVGRIIKGLKHVNKRWKKR